MRNLTVALLTIFLITAEALAEDAETIDAPALMPSGNEAVVYFYRPNMIGGAIKFWTFVDETPIGVLRGKQVTGAVVPAGERVIWARSGNVSATRMRLEPGATYYFHIGSRMGGVKARAALEAADAAEAIEDIDGLKFRVLTDEGRAQAAEYRESDYAEAIERASQSVADD